MELKSVFGLVTGYTHTDGGNLIGTPPHYRLADMKVNDLLVPG